MVAALLASGCHSLELPTAAPPDSYVRELTPEDLSVLRTVLQPCRICPESSGTVLVANRTLRLCDPPNGDDWCVTPFDVALLGAKRGPFGFARAMFGRNRFSMAIQALLPAGFLVVSFETVSMRG